jgi:HD-GYP domain-containing protein (c-di-GMP phosphodiesterase class II)
MDIVNDYELAKHGIRVGALSEELSKSLGLDNTMCKMAFISGTYHDIGKYYINPNILYKKDKLNMKEFEYIKRHTTSYSNFFNNNNINDPMILKAIKHHHENFDGTGYPDKLKGNQIPVLSRIIKICDYYDSVTSKRVYRNIEYTKDEAIDIMIKHINEFDMSILKTFIKLIEHTAKLGA